MESMCEQLHIRPRRRIRNADDAGSVGAQQRMEIEIAGVVHQDGIARLKQESAQQIDRLCPRLHEHDLVRRSVDTAIAHSSCDELTQRRQSEGRSVVGQR